MSKATADVSMVGTALGAPAIAGVGYGVPFWTMTYMLGGGIAGGTISLVSQRYGAEKHDQIGTAVTVSVVFALAVTIPLMVLFWVAPGPFIRLIGSGDQAIEYGIRYLRVASFAMPFAALNLIGSRTLIGADDAWTPMVIRSGTAIANVGVNAVLIFVFDMGVVGAALGTVIGSVVGLTLFATGLTSGRLPVLGGLPVRISRASIGWDGSTARHLTQISVPLALRKVAQNGGQFPILAIVGLFGPQIVAAYVVALRIRALMNTPGWGFGLASSSLVGQALGQMQEALAEDYAQEALRFTVSVYAIVGVVVFILAEPISTLFLRDASTLATTTTLVRATCVSVLLWGLMNGALGPLRTSGDTAWPFYAQLLGLFLFSLPVAYIGATTSLGLGGLYAALVLETGVPALVVYGRFRTGKWKAISRANRSLALGAT